MSPARIVGSVVVLLAVACSAPQRAPPDPAEPPTSPTAPTVSAPPAAEAPSKSPQPSKPEAVVPKKEAARTLDLNSLETRLKDTDAIGVFTKISVKNQVDDLLDQFRKFAEGRSRVGLPELRQQYDQLLLKVVALLQDSDPPLAKDIIASREKLWNILTDPATFATS